MGFGGWLRPVGGGTRAAATIVGVAAMIVVTSPALDAAVAMDPVATSASASPTGPIGPSEPTATNETPAPTPTGTPEPTATNDTPTPTGMPEPTATNDTPTQIPTETPGPGGVTVTEDCGGGHSTDTITVHNTTAAPVPITVSNFGSPIEHFVVPAGGSHSLTFNNSGAPFNIVFERDDTGEVLFESQAFLCPTRIDHSFTVTAGTTFTSPTICPVALFLSTLPTHGTARTDVAGISAFFTYTPAAGFVGKDSFDYSCITSAAQFGTIHLTVVPAAVAPTTPAAARGLPATGQSRLPSELGISLGLVLIGVVVLWLTRGGRPFRS